MSEEKKVMIVAGEASGDQHAAKLVHEIRNILGDGTRFSGAAGEKMRSAGVEATVRSDELSIVGLLEIGRALPMFLRAYRKLVFSARSCKPDVAVLVDFPDFNLKLARSLKRLGIPVVYYISPQLWAWRRYRLRSVKRFVDLMIVILPFEKTWYEKHGVNNVEYVGSPLTREIHSNISKADFCAKHGLDPTKPIISLLPGSRSKEIVRILPELLRTAAEVKVRRPEVQFLIALSSRSHEPQIGTAMKELSNEIGAEHVLPLTVIGETYDALNASDAAAITSGTATLEAGIIGTPMAIVYKTSSINYGLLRPLISVDHFGLINLIAEKRIAKEFIQDDLTIENLSNELLRLIEPGENAKARRDLTEAVEKLGHGGASKRAAEAIARLIR